MKIDKIFEILEAYAPLAKKIDKQWGILKRHRDVGVPVWDKDMEFDAKTLRKQGYSYREIAYELEIPKSTVFDHVSPKGRYYKGWRRFLRI